MGITKDFGQRIKELRLKKGITQYQLAEAAGVDPKHISHIETGRSFPKADLIEKFSKELDVDIATMFNFSPFKPKQELMQEIDIMLKDAEPNDVQRLYKIIVAYLK